MLSQHHKSNCVSHTDVARGFTTVLSTCAKEIMSQETSLAARDAHSRLSDTEHHLQ